jgi:hypothetical protein
MKSVGEAMAIGRTFKESLQKCLRSPGDTVTVRDQPQRSGRRRQTLAHHGSLWRPRHPPARRHQPQTGDDLKVVVLRGALIDAGEQCQRDKTIVQFDFHE